MSTRPRSSGGAGIPWSPPTGCPTGRTGRARASTSPARGVPAARRRSAPARGDRAAGPVRAARDRRVHVAAAGRDAPGLVRSGGAQARRTGQLRPGHAADVHPGQLVARHRLGRRPLPDRRALGVRLRRPADPGCLLLLHAPPRHAAAAGRRRHRGGPRGTRRGRTGGPVRPVPRPRRALLAERLQVQQLQLPRRHHGHRRAAADLADLGQGPRSAHRPRAVVRRGPAGRPARDSPPEEEGVFAVVPLAWEGGAAPGADRGPSAVAAVPPRRAPRTPTRNAPGRSPGSRPYGGCTRRL